ncbi:hypothetical protein [Flagellimonas sp.]|uniref:hypothetical protein n=1 Tax=Flagellimonas sp. TaxID=2058762 RepID=UPI003BAEB3F0
MIEGFKSFVRSGEMTISLGVALALFEPGEHRVKRMIESRTFDLSRACFDLTDKT